MIDCNNCIHTFIKDAEAPRCARFGRRVIPTNSDRLLPHDVCRGRQYEEHDTMIDCNNCTYISVTEGNQTKDKEHHVCTLHGMQVLHLGHHPRLLPVDICDGEDFKERGIDDESTTT